MCWGNMGDPSLAAPSSSSSPSHFLPAYCRELNMEPLKVFLFQNIFCISYNRYYNDSMHLLKIYGFRLLLVITNSCYIQVVINMSDVQLKSLFFSSFFLTSLPLCGTGIWAAEGSVCGPGQEPMSGSCCREMLLLSTGMAEGCKQLCIGTAQ